MKSGDDTGFLMSAGRFIERWLGENPSPECPSRARRKGRRLFPAGKTRQHRAASRSGATPSSNCCARPPWPGWPRVSVRHGCRPGPRRRPGRAARWTPMTPPNTTRRSVSGCKAGTYEDLTADTLYNIGNACYRAGSPGHAALYYRRALARDPGHQESRQNLRFIERKCGAITVHRPEYQYALARFPLAAWQGMLWTGVWLCVLAALVFPATRPGARVRVVAVAALVIAPLLAAFGGSRLAVFPQRRRVRAPRTPSRHHRGKSHPACRCRADLAGSDRRAARLALRGDPRIGTLGLRRIRHQNPRLDPRGCDRKSRARHAARPAHDPQTQSRRQKRLSMGLAKKVLRIRLVIPQEPVTDAPARRFRRRWCRWIGTALFRSASMRWIV